MNTVTESIYSGKGVTVPLADVQHIEKHNPQGLIVVTRHTRWDAKSGGWANNIWIDKAEADAFTHAWCHYRSELEADTLADLSPQPRGDELRSVLKDLIDDIDEMPEIPQAISAATLTRARQSLKRTLR